MRFEFMEFLVRAAIRKFLNKPSGERQCASMSEAFEKMFKEHILPRQPPDALVDKDEFRRTRLYKYVSLVGHGIGVPPSTGLGVRYSPHGGCVVVACAVRGWTLC